MRLTLREMQQMTAGRYTFQVLHGFYVKVEIIDARQVFGRVDVLIKPIDEAGTGSTWIEFDRLKAI